MAAFSLGVKAVQQISRIVKCYVKLTTGLKATNDEHSFLDRCRRSPEFATLDLYRLNLKKSHKGSFPSQALVYSIAFLPFGTLCI